MAPVIANYFDQITLAGNGQYHNSLLLSALDANSVVFNNMTYSCVWSCSIDEDLETICIMGLAQPALSTTGKQLIRLRLPQLESSLGKLSRASQPAFPTMMQTNGRTILYEFRGFVTCAVNAV